MHITFDIDGVLANFAKGFAGVLEDLYDIKTDPNACKAWHWFEWVDDLTEQQEKNAWDAIFVDPRYHDFWRDLEPLCTDMDVKRINRLADDHVITFVTNRAASGQHDTALHQAREWLFRQGFRPSHNVFLAKAKAERAKQLGTQVAIEDNGNNAIEYLDYGIHAVLLRRPYNEAFVELVKSKGGSVVDTLGEFINMCFQVDARQETYEEPLAARALWHSPTFREPADVVVDADGPGPHTLQEVLNDTEPATA